ncbi:MAG: hypothetical protein ACOVKV_10835, partial [Novosphingobium sp.]
HQNLLVERDGRTGHGENFVRIALERDSDRPDPSHIGRIVPVTITGQNGDMLNGGRLVIDLDSGLSSVDGRSGAGGSGRVTGTFRVRDRN